MVKDNRECRVITVQAKRGIDGDICRL